MTIAIVGLLGQGSYVLLTHLRTRIGSYTSPDVSSLLRLGSIPLIVAVAIAVYFLGPRLEAARSLKDSLYWGVYICFAISFISASLYLALKTAFAEPSGVPSGLATHHWVIIVFVQMLIYCFISAMIFGPILGYLSFDRPIAGALR
ncbi:MAG TPA: hypothetical protein VGB85_27660 [Nannocystis sp.]